MKTQKIIPIGLLALVIAGFSSCTETITVKDHEMALAKADNRSEEVRDSLEREYIVTLDQIDHNLDVIRDRQGMLVLGPNTNSDRGISKKEQILNNIKMINTLLDDNRKKLARLESSLAKYKKGKEELLLSINLAKERITAQEETISQLKKQLQDGEFKMADLNRRLDEKDQLLGEKTTLAQTLEEKNGQLNRELNKVYFVYGTYKELKRNKIIKKRGGVLGLGKVKTINTKIEKEKFATLDQQENTAISIRGKEPKLITQHPAGTYSVNVVSDNLAMLMISDPERFWSSSRYLVVEVQ